MIDIEAVMADFAVRQAERQTEVAEEIQQLKTAVLPRLQDAGIAASRSASTVPGTAAPSRNVRVWMQPVRRSHAPILPCTGRRSRQGGWCRIEGDLSDPRRGPRATDLSGARTPSPGLGDQRRRLRRP